MDIHQALVPFHGDSVLLLNADGEPFVPVRPLCEKFGLAWKPQFTKLKASSNRYSVTMMVTETGSGERETTCIPLRKLPAWLYSINPAKVAPEIRETLTRYQTECDDVLWRHWSGGMREELTALRAQAASLREMTLALSPKVSQIVHLQKAGVARWAVHAHLGIGWRRGANLIDAYEQGGLIDPKAWPRESDDYDIETVAD